MTKITTRRIGTAAAAEILGVSDETVRAEIRRGRLPAIRVGRCYRVLESDLDAYIAAGSSAAATVLRVTACEHEAGAEVRISGPSGSGKSALTSALRNLWGDAVTGHRYGDGGEVLRLATAEVAPSIAEVVAANGLPERYLENAAA